MSKDIIGALRVTLGFDTTEFEHGSQRAKQVTKRDTAEMKRDLDGVRGAVTGMVGAFLGVEAVQAAKRALSFAASIKNVASEAGVSKKELQEYRAAAADAGLTHAEMDGTLKSLTKTIGEAKAGTKEQATIFRDLGVAVQDANGRVYSAGEVIPKLADALSRIKDPATRARLETKLFGETGQKLDAMLTQGSKGIELMRKRAHELGLVLGDDLVDSADKAQSKLEQIKSTLDVRFASLVAKNADSIVALADSLSTLVTKGLELVTQYPRISGALAGIAAGARFGAPGAAVGGVAGVLLGDAGGRAADDGNMNLAYRMKRLKEAQDELKARRSYAKDGGGLFNFRRTGPNVEGGTLETQTEEVRRQTALLQQATAMANAPQATGTIVPDGALPTPNPGRTRKGPKDRTEELAQRYRDELAGLYDDQLGLEQDTTTDLRERARIEHERAQAAKDAYDTDVDSRVKQGELTAEQAQQLKLQRARNFDLEKQAINWPLDDALLEQQNRVTQESLDREKDMLSMRAALATTAKERRAIQLQLLDNELASARLAAQEVLDRHDSSAVDKQIAQAKLDQLDSIRTGKTGEINRQTMGPLESYMDSIPDTAEEINEAYENIAANGIRSMVDGLGNAASETLKLKGIAGQLFNQLIADLIRFQMQQTLTGGGGGGLFGSLLTGFKGLFGTGTFGGGPNPDGSMSLSSSVASNNFTGPRFAGGGDMTILGRRGIDRNVLSLNGMPIANVSYGEKLSIANDNHGQRFGGGGQIFDMRGAVMTEDLLMQMQRIGMSAQSGAVVMMDKRNVRRARNRLGK